jgi:hypothetical protein
MSAAVNEMVRKLDARQPGSSGYVTTTPELIDILSELSKLVPVSIVVDRDVPGELSVMIKVGFALERSEL